MNDEEQVISSVLFKAGQLTNDLQVSATSIRRWVHRYPNFFSETSQIEDRYKVRYTFEDALVIATIQYLSGRGATLDEVEKQLLAGVRHGQEKVEEILAKSVTKSNSVKHSLNPKLVQFELKQTRAERDQALSALRQLEEKYEAVLREISEVKYRLGVAEGELNLLRRQTEQGR